MSPIKLQKARRQIEELLDKGYIRPSKSPFGAPILFVRKENGTLRMCVDYRGLNLITKRNLYALPRIDELLEGLACAKFFSKLDLASGYHQVHIALEDIEKTTFNSQYGHYEWLVISFGMTNAPATFQDLMNSVFQDMLSNGVVVYLDDILLYGSCREHLSRLQQVFQRLREHQLYVPAAKCEFLQPRIEYLGHVIDQTGIQVDPTKVSVVKDWPAPTNVKEVQSFLGFASYYRRFVKQFSLLAAPLTQITQKRLRLYGQKDSNRLFRPSRRP